MCARCFSEFWPIYTAQDSSFALSISSNVVGPIFVVLHFKEKVPKIVNSFPSYGQFFFWQPLVRWQIFIILLSNYWILKKLVFHTGFLLKKCNCVVSLSQTDCSWLLQGKDSSEDANWTRDTPQRSDSKRWSTSQSASSGVRTRGISALEIAAEQVAAYAERKGTERSRLWRLA